jgi:serine/threonine-protein phosphatase 6 regulatory ankyrin repeat subunit B
LSTFQLSELNEIFITAVKNNNKEKVDEILASTNIPEQKKAIIDAQDDKGQSALYWAVEKNNDNLVDFLLLNKAKVDSVTNNKHSFPGYTPLMEASKNGNKQIVAKLLQNGASIRHQSKDKEHAAYRAAYNGHVEVLQLLIEGDSSQNIEGDETVSDLKGLGGWTPLNAAALEGKLITCKFLVNGTSGVDIDSKDVFGQTPLMNAATYGHEEVVSFLLSKGANASLVDNRGRNALTIARDENEEECVKVILQMIPTMNN